MNDWKLGIVEWFDNDKGEGMVKSEGVSYYFHYSAIYMTQVDALVEL